MTNPDDVRFSNSHEWARRDGGVVTVGISAHAVDQLNKELVYVELPEPGRQLRHGDTFGVIESVKAASDLYAPVSGLVTEVNEAAAENPSLVSEDPYGKGWMIKIEPSNADEFDRLLSPADYEKMAAEDTH